MRRARRPPWHASQIDADDFKDINDRFGHNVGDEALQAIAAANTGILRTADVCGRIGDEIVSLSVSIGAAVLHGGADASSVMRLADKRLYGAKAAGRNQTVFPQGALTMAAA